MVGPGPPYRSLILGNVGWASAQIHPLSGDIIVSTKLNDIPVWVANSITAMSSAMYLAIFASLRFKPAMSWAFVILWFNCVYPKKSLTACSGSGWSNELGSSSTHSSGNRRAYRESRKRLPMKVMTPRSVSERIKRPAA